jgi:hypothetical protein
MFSVVWDVADHTRVKMFDTAAKARAFFDKITSEPTTITAWMSNARDKTLHTYDRDADDPSLD